MPSTRTAKLPSPAVMPMAPARSWCRSRHGSRPRRRCLLGDFGGDFLVDHIDHPPMAPLPYSSAAGPRNTDALGQQRLGGHGMVGRDGRGVHQLGAVGQRLHARRAVWPRITGRLAPPPKVSLCTPGRPSSVSPNVPPRARPVHRLPAREAGCVVLFRSSPSGLADTVTGASVAAASAWPAALPARWRRRRREQRPRQRPQSLPGRAGAAGEAPRSLFLSLHLDSYGCYIITNKNQMI